MVLAVRDRRIERTGLIRVIRCDVAEVERKRHMGECLRGECEPVKMSRAYVTTRIQIIDVRVYALEGEGKEVRVGVDLQVSRPSKAEVGGSPGELRGNFLREGGGGVGQRCICVDLEVWYSGDGERQDDADPMGRLA